MPRTIKARYKLRSGTTAEWAANDEVLAAAEVGEEVTTTGERLRKIGNGIDKFSDLPYRINLPIDRSVPPDDNQTLVYNASTGLLEWADGVTSFNGRTGNVTPASGDYTFAQLANTPTTLAGYGITDAVTSVGLSAPASFTVSGSPVTGSGTLTFSYAAGYQGYTSAEAAKLAGIQAGAEVNVNADWNAGSGDAQILNKPTLYTDADAVAAVVASGITDGDTTHAPSGDVVNDALAGKANLSGGNTFSGAQIFNTTPVLAESTSGPMQHRIFSAVGSVADIILGEGGASKWLFRKGASNELQILALGGAGAVLNINQADGDLRPGGASGSKNLGSSSLRWKEIFAVNGTINTSDAREKTTPRHLTPDELAAALDIARLPCVFQWLHAIEAKGEEGARLHASPTVQSVIAIMESHGLDPMRYGFVCYDEWDETPEVKDEQTGEVTQEYRPAGDRYSLRPSELAHFVMRGLAHRQDELERRLAALEALD